MTAMPEPHARQPHATTAGQPDINSAARAFLNDIEDALAEAARPARTIPTSFRDPRPVPAIGTTPPVSQPGRPAMSEKAVDDTARMIGASVVIGMTGAAATGVLWASGHADPEVIAWVCAAPIGLAVPILALSSLVKRFKQAVEAAPPQIHQHYSGHVYQDNRENHLHTETRGVWATTRNELPPTR